MRPVGHLLGPGELILIGVSSWPVVVTGEAGSGPPLSRLAGVQLRPGDVLSAAAGQSNLRGQSSLSVKKRMIIENYHHHEKFPSFPLGSFDLYV